MNVLGIVLVAIGLIAFMGSITVANLQARKSGGFLKTNKKVFIPLILGSWLVFGCGCLLLSMQ